MKRLHGWLLAGGILLAIAGLTLLPGGMGPEGEETAMAGGAILFSIGILLVALAFYLKARLLQSLAGPTAKPQRKKDRCEACEVETANIRCTVHDIRLCAACLPHHDIASCSYVPTSRKLAATAAK